MLKLTGFITSLIILFSSIGANQTPEQEELNYLASFILENNLDVAEWEVIYKDKRKVKTVQKLVRKIKDSHLVTVSENENTIKYVIEDRNKTETFNVQYSVLISKQATSYAEVHAVISGTSWNNAVRDAYRSFSQTKNKFFTRTSQKFTCIKTKDSGIIEIGVLLTNLDDKLNLLHIATQTDTVEDSTHKNIIYGYTPLWEQKMLINSKPLNIQIVEKEADENQSNLTIGTPILVNEY
ncbi:YwmB family TATA-box binding protein [Virgibacillus sp. W0430]|uniref:YwmB family TATA-box binding protein n=1 Tax=Virgibacillus sp. W0430 TaxID=3391580 RepID=UPI003F48FD74